MKNNIPNLKTDLLVRNHTSSAIPEKAELAEMFMVLTLDQLKPNPDNPRLKRNPKYQEIKESIKANKGLNSLPKVTKNPESEDDIYIFSDGGNTRYSILSELWEETHDEKFWRIGVMFKPWPGRLKCVIGHLAENDVRGDLMFIEKALGIEKARSIHEEALERQISQRELEILLRSEGYPIDQSSISRMEYTVKYLYPSIPKLLMSGMGRPQVIQLIFLRNAAEKAWDLFSLSSDPKQTFDDIFNTVGSLIDNPESYSFDDFKDQLIIKCLGEFPNSTYDQWLIELDPKEQNRRKLFGEPINPISNESIINELPSAAELNDNTEKPLPKKAPKHLESEQSISEETKLSENPSPPTNEAHQIPNNKDDSIPESPILFAQTGLEPVSDIWHITALQDDIEHLQDIAYRLAFELAEFMICSSDIQEDSNPFSCGFRITPINCDKHLGLKFLSTLTGADSTEALPNDVISSLMIGTDHPDNYPAWDDISLVKCLRLIRVLRRLRELQRINKEKETML